MTSARVCDVYGTLFEAHAAIRRHFGRGAGRQQMLEIVARETGRIYLDLDTLRPLRRLLDAHRAHDRFSLARFSRTHAC